MAVRRTSLPHGRETQHDAECRIISNNEHFTVIPGCTHPDYSRDPKVATLVNMLASGFTNAPISRFLVIAVIASSLLVSVTDTKHFFWIAIRPHICDYRQLWRFLTWPLCYTNSTEVLFSAMTLYQLRIVERLWGTRKFAVCTPCRNI